MKLQVILFKLMPYFNMVLLLIQHPVTTEAGDSFLQIKETVDAIREVDVQTVALLPNNDAGYSNIIDYIKQSGIKWYPSLPTDIFINLYRNVNALIGNSSSGVREAPFLGVPSINIGTRQNNRNSVPTIINCNNSKATFLTFTEFSDIFGAVGE